MTEEELSCIEQLAAVSIIWAKDTLALAAEVRRLRAAIADATAALDRVPQTVKTAAVVPIRNRLANAIHPSA